ncbi:hypothetical protein DFQ27_009629 [Actinomortierella ambigua]|uniref:Uncharacterized protein n=1 Tax=Actinomortierella ambigua TaxID=1343610 RepID=A0A9P6QIH4_9FUNG|nr:hypothetical protein DFQ27_009629 [Actinomortierella ambigua]
MVALLTDINNMEKTLVELELKKRECEKKTDVAMDSLPVTLPPDLYCFDRAEDRKATEATD